MSKPDPLETYILDKLEKKREKLLKSWKYGAWFELTFGIVMTAGFTWALLFSITAHKAQTAVPLYILTIIVLVIHTFSKVGNCLQMQDNFGDDYMKNNTLPLKFTIKEHENNLMKLDNGEIEISILTPERRKHKKVEVLFEITDYKLTNYYIA